jgi:hypothetical protein
MVFSRDQITPPKKLPIRWFTSVETSTATMPKKSVLIAANGIKNNHL